MDDRIFGHIVQEGEGDSAQYIVLHPHTKEYEWTGNHEDATRFTYARGQQIVELKGGRVVPLVSEEMLLGLQDENKQFVEKIQSLNQELERNQSLAHRIKAWVDDLAGVTPRRPKSG